MKIQLEEYLHLPYPSGEIVDRYLAVLQENVEYPAFTIDSNLNVIECVGIIKKNGSYNYHNNYDDSSNELYCLVGNEFNNVRSEYNQWFSLNKNEVIELQKKLIVKWKSVLERELKRINEL